MLKCQICDELVENKLIILSEHIEKHVGNFEEEAEIEGQDIDKWVLSYFDSLD